MSRSPSHAAGQDDARPDQGEKSRCDAHARTHLRVGHRCRAEPSADWGVEDTRVADAVKRLSELKACGVDTIVDLTVVGLGRYIPRVARVAAETDITSSSPPASTRSTTCPCTFTISGPGRSRRRDHDRDVRPRHRGRRGSPPNRCADLHPHPRRLPPWARTAAGVRRRGRRSESCGHRPFGDSTDIATGGVDRQRLVYRHGSVRHRCGVAVRGAGEHSGRVCERGHADKMVLRTTPIASRRRCRKRWSPRRCQLLVQNPRKIFENQGR